MTARHSHKPPPDTTKRAPHVSRDRSPDRGYAYLDTPGHGHGDAVLRAVGQAGMPLPAGLRRHVEARFGQDFSQVRIHTNGDAAESAADLHANAYTLGHHIVFAAGRYAPHDVRGRRLLGHELAHVIQQGRGGSAPALDPYAGHEQAADRAASQFSNGQGPVRVSGGTALGVAREEDDEARKGKKKKGARPASDPLEERLRKVEADAATAGLPRSSTVRAAAEVRKRIGRDRDSAEEMIEGLERRVRSAAGATDLHSQVLEDIDSVQAQRIGPERGASGKRRQSTADIDRAALEQGRPSRRVAKKASLQSGERLGTAGGLAQAEKEGITLADWNSPQQHVGDYGTGIDAWGISKRGKILIIENKYGASGLNKSDGVRQMSNEWVGRKIAELRMVGDTETAEMLLQAARDNRLQGVVYWTRDLKKGPKTTRRRSAQLRDKLGDEQISESGLIQYAPGKIERAYEAHREKLERDLRNGTLPRNITRMRNKAGSAAAVEAQGAAGQQPATPPAQQGKRPNAGTKGGKGRTQQPTAAASSPGTGPAGKKAAPRKRGRQASATSATPTKGNKAAQSKKKPAPRTGASKQAGVASPALPKNKGGGTTRRASKQAGATGKANVARRGGPRSLANEGAGSGDVAELAAATPAANRKSEPKSASRTKKAAGAPRSTTAGGGKGAAGKPHDAADAYTVPRAVRKASAKPATRNAPRIASQGNVKPGGARQASATPEPGAERAAPAGTKKRQADEKQATARKTQPQPQKQSTAPAHPKAAPRKPVAVPAPTSGNKPETPPRAAGRTPKPSPAKAMPAPKAAPKTAAQQQTRTPPPAPGTGQQEQKDVPPRSKPRQGANKSAVKPAPATSRQSDAGASLIAGPDKAGVQVNASVQSKTDYGKGRSVTKTAAFSGKAWVETSEIPFSKPPRYRIVFHLNLGGQAGGKAEKEGSRGSVSAGVAASGSLDLTVAHEFSAEETRRYLADVTAGSSGAWRELRVAQLAAAGSIDDARALAGQMRALAGSPQGLAQMKEGDEIALGATGSIEGNLGASGGGKGGGSVGLQLGAGAQSGLERRVALRDGKYIVTVTSTKGTDTTIGATGGYGVASMGVSRADSATQGLSVSFAIDANDPARDARFAEISKAGSIEALQGLQARYPDLVSSRTTSRGKGTGTTTTAGVGGLSLDIVDRGEINEEVTEGPEGVTRTYRAQGTGGATLRAGSKPVVSASDTNAFTGGAGPDNAGFGETRNERRETDFTRSAQKFAGNFNKAPVGTVVGAFTGSTPVLQESVQQHGASLTDDSYAALIALAKNPNEWSRAWSGSFGTWQAWMDARPKVLAAGQNRQLIAKAVAEFESESGRGRSDTVQRAVGSTAIAFEFPDAIADQKALYDALIVGDPIAAAQAAGDDTAQLARLKSDMEKLDALDRKISDNSGAFERPGDFIEMRQRIGERRSAMRTALNRLAAPNAKTAAAGPARDGGAPAPAAAAAAAHAPRSEADEAAARKAEEAQKLQQDTTDTIGRLQSYRRVEQGVFAAMETEFKGSTVFGYELPKLSNPSVIELTSQQNKLKDAYPKWGKDIAQLRRLIQQAGGDPAKADTFKPDRARYLELDRKVPYHSYGAGLPGYEEI